MSSTEALQPDGDAVLYLIDASPSMVRSGLFEQVVDAVVTSIKQVQRQGDRQFDTGVIVYNITNPDFRRTQFVNLQVMMRIAKPTTSDLKALIFLANQEDLSQDFDASSLVNALQQAKLELALLKPSIFRRLVIITDNDKPCEEADLRRLQLLTHDLVQMDVLIAPMFLESSYKRFDPSSQWAKLVYLPPSLSRAREYSNLTVSMEPYNVDDLGADLITLVQSKAERKMTLFRGIFSVASLMIGIAAYKIVSRCLPPHSQFVAKTGSDAPHRVRSGVSLVYKDNRTIAGDSEVRRQYVLGTYGEVPLPIFQAEELEILRPSSHSPHLELISFVHAQRLHEFGMTTSSILIVPSNHSLANSKKAFASLRRSMIRQHKVAYVRYFPKNNHKPAVNGLMYAYDPFSNHSDSQRVLNPSVACGMYFVELPFADDLRHGVSQSRTNLRVSPTLESHVISLVKKFRYQPGFDPAQFPNPAIAQFASILESAALENETELYTISDSTKPNYEKIARNASCLAKNIQQSIIQTEEPRPPEAKKAKGMNMQEFIEAHGIGRLHLFTVPELRWALREQGLINTGRKEELLDRLSVHFALTL